MRARKCVRSIGEEILCDSYPRCVNECSERSKNMRQEVMDKLKEREILTHMPQLVEAERRRRICDDIRRRRKYSTQKVIQALIWSRIANACLQLIANYGFPRPPILPFARFCAEYMRNLPDTTARKTAMKEAAERWRNMTHDEKLVCLEWN